MKHTLHQHAARYRTRKRNGETHIFVDVGLITLGVLVAVILGKTGITLQLIALAGELEVLGSFIAGMFFTSAFTTAPAIVTLGSIALSNPPLLVALLGALGAMTGDLILFRFVRDRFASDILELLGERHALKQFHMLFKRRFFRWFTLLLGGLIIASPLPDELAVAVLGFTRMGTRSFLCFSFVVNFFAILVIGLAARALTGA